MPTVYVEGYTKQPSGTISYVEIPVGSSWDRGQPGTALAVQENPQSVRATVIPLTNVAVAMTDDAVAGGHGNKLLYILPGGATQIQVAAVNIAIAADAGLVANAALVGSLGTTATATDNATLTGTEANIIASTGCTLAASAGTFNAVSGTVVPMDGRTTAVSVFLNFAVPDAGITGPAVLTVNGEVRLSWVVI